MLSSVLNSEIAIRVNIQIIRVFTKLRLSITDNLTIKLEIEDIKKKLSNQHKNIELIFLHLEKLVENDKDLTPRQKLVIKTDLYQYKNSYSFFI